MRARRTPGPQISCPGDPSGAQTFASVPRVVSLRVKPLSARAAARFSPPVGAAGRDATPGPGAATWLLLALTTAALCASPTLGLHSAPNSTSCPAEDSWWSGLVIIVAVVCASLVFLTVLVIICYKAIKRKPLRKDENGTSIAEYPMSSSQSSKGVDVNTAVV